MVGWRFPAPWSRSHSRREWPAEWKAAFTSFWSLPLLIRLDHTRALAWGRVTIGDVGSLLARHPLLPLIVLLALPLAGDPRSPVRILQRWPWATALVVVVDALVLEPLGL